MDLSTFIVTVFCLIDDRLKERRIRSRGLTPTLSDSEVITIEILGEFLGLDEDTELLAYFRRHYAHYFPNLTCVHRTTFARQAANLWNHKRIRNLPVGGSSLPSFSGPSTRGKIPG